MLNKTPTLTRWLVALVAVAVLPTLIAAVSALLYAYNEEQKGFHDGLKDTTRALALVVDREIARREAIALTLAGSPTLTRGDLQAFHEYASQISPTRDKVVVLHDLNGAQLVNTRLPFGADLPRSSPLTAERKALGPLPTLVSNLYFAPVGKRYSFAVQVPVVRDGRVLYYVSIGGYASALQSIIEDQRVSAGWMSAILDAKGVVVARNVAPERYVGQRVNEQLAEQLARLREGSFETISIEGTPVLATFSKSPNYGWAVLVGVPADARSGPLQIVGGFALVAALLLAASLVAALRVARRLLRPVQRLTEASSRIGSGQPIDTGSTGLAETDQVIAALQEAERRIAAANRAMETKRGEAEAAAAELRKSSERLQVATDASGLALFTWEPAADLVEWHNDMPYRIFGMPRSEAPLTAARFVSHFLHEQDAGELTRRVRETLANDAQFHFRGRIRRQDDQQQRWVEFTGRPQRRTATAPVVVVGTAVDVTERVLAETALRENEERLHQLANSIPNLAWMANADGWITWYNDRWYEYTGTNPEEMTGWGWQRVHDAAVLPDVMRKWTESIATGRAFEMTFPLRGKDGNYRPFYTLVAPLRDTSGAVVQWFGTNTDVSTLKKAEEELRDADRKKDEFLAVLAHELRNPLAPIRLAAELLKRIPTNEPQVAKSSEIIARQVSHMTGLLNDLLDISRITRGLVRIDRERVNVAAVAASALEQARPLVDAKGHHVRWAVEDPGITVVASPIRLTQVIANLIDNAAKYSPPNAHIDIGIRRDRGDVVIAISDDGQGISAELLPHVFEAFTQAERGTRSQSGLGLGLAVVRGLVELQGGTVSARSDGPGKGSRFVVVFPEAKDEPAPANVEARVERTATAPQLLKLLVVDDNRDAADSLVTLLRGIGHGAELAYTGEEALKLLRHARFDAAILDIGLPDMSGHQLAATIRAGGMAVGPLIALTGFGQSQDRDASDAAGFTHHLVKPVETDVLLETLASIPASAEGG